MAKAGQSGSWAPPWRSVSEEVHQSQQPVTALWLVFQEAVFDKGTGKVMLKTFSLYKKLLTLFRAGHDQGEALGMPGLRLLVAGLRAEWRLGWARGLETGRLAAW